jgi:hypothetical protein
MKYVLALAILRWDKNSLSSAFSPVECRLGAVRVRQSISSDSSLFAEGFGSGAAVKDRPSKKKATTTSEQFSVESMSAEEAKKRLIDLIPRMTGKDEEYRAVEAYVNLLEDKYSPVQTIDFLNLAMSGSWQLVSAELTCYCIFSFLNLSIGYSS